MLMTKRFSQALRTLLPALLLSGCALFKPQEAVKTCRFSFHSLSFAGLDKRETHWKLKAGVTNPNIRPVKLLRMQFALHLDRDTLFSGWNPEERILAPRDSQEIQVDLNLPNNILKRLPPELLTNTDAQFLLTADAYVDTWLGEVRIPNALKQTIHMNMPEILNSYSQQLFKRFLGGGQGFFRGPGQDTPPGTPPDSGSGETAPDPDDPI